MVRYARAKGSKSSNEKLPDEATPWHVMKEQLEEVQRQKTEFPVEKKTAKQLLSEEDKSSYLTGTNTKTDWATFEDSSAKKSKTILNKVKDKQIQKKEKTKKKKIKESIDKECTKAVNNTEQESNKEIINVKSVSDVQKATDKELNYPSEGTEINPSTKQKKSRKKSKQKNDVKATDQNDSNENSKSEKKPQNPPAANYVKAVGQLTASAKRRLRRERLSNKISSNGSTKIDTSDVSGDKQDKPNLKRKINDSEATEKVSEPNKTVEKQTLTKRQKRNLKKKNCDGRNLNEDNDMKNGGQNMENNTDFKRNNVQTSKDNHFDNKIYQKNHGKIARHNHNKPGKVRDDKEHPRRKADVAPLQMVINGVEVEIVKYDGFPVRKQDAEMLKDLRQQMVIKGIPKSEIDIAMKLERRKAEKALARLRKQVCFLCRMSGHNLSDCPNLDKEQSSTGICFKCGSTEHTHFECKVNKTDDYRFASCFICRQRGHVAKQCPDNPKGLYPDGGSCKICGDVTHLKKDCPDLLKKKEENTLTVKTISNNDLESLDEDTSKCNETTKIKKQNVVKF